MAQLCFIKPRPPAPPPPALPRAQNPCPAQKGSDLGVRAEQYRLRQPELMPWHCFVSLSQMANKCKAAFTRPLKACATGMTPVSGSLHPKVEERLIRVGLQKLSFRNSSRVLYCALGIRAEAEQYKTRDSCKTKDQSRGLKQEVKTRMQEHVQAAHTHSVLLYALHHLLEMSSHTPPLSLPPQLLGQSCPNPVKITPVSWSTTSPGEEAEGTHSTAPTSSSPTLQIAARQNFTEG